LIYVFIESTGLFQNNLCNMTPLWGSNLIFDNFSTP
jgi:hypothetical protein